jgi:hypothetical protein
MPNQRLQKDTRLIWYPEGTATPGADTGITTGYVVPLAGESGVGDTQDPVRMPIGMGDGLSDSLVPGLIQYGGTIPVGLDYDFFGHPLRALWSGYASVLQGGAFYAHEFFEDVATAGSRPKTFQLQDEFLESTAIYVRGRYNRVGGIELRGDFAGGAQASITTQGTGDIVETDLAGTKTNYGFGASSYFDGQADYEVSGTRHTLSGQAGINAFACRINRPTERSDAFFNQGAAAHVNPGILNISADIGVPMNVGGTGPTADLNLYSDAKNRRVVVMNWVLANGPILTCTAYLRTQVIGYVFRNRPKPGPGGTGLKYNATFEISRMPAASMKVPGEYHSTIRGPYTIAAGTAVLGVLIDGVAKSVTLTTGTRTTDQVVADLNASAPFFAVAFADNFLGFVRITTRTAGSTGSVAFNTVIANTGHALFGYNATVHSGRDNCQGRQILYNSISSAY